jgi:uncharacterized protein (TIGR03067 family)
MCTLTLRNAVPGFLQFGRTGILLAAALLCITGCSTLSSSDETRLQGEWRVVSGHENGKPFEDGGTDRLAISFRGDKVVLSENGHSAPAMTFRLDKTKAPQHIDFERDGKLQPGIYEFTSDALRLCLDQSRHLRPTSFEQADAKKGFICMTLMRPGQPAKTVPPGSEGLQGTWTVTSAKRGGISAPAEQIRDWTIVFRGDRIDISFGEEKGGGAYKVETSGEPRTIDVSGRGGAFPRGETVLGIYSVRGDTLIYSWVKGGKQRPTDFESKPGSDQATLELRRTGS